MGKTISELIEKTSANDSDVLFIEDSTSTNKITKANFLKELVNKTDILSDRVEAVEKLKEGSELEVTTEKGYVVCENTNNGQIEGLMVKGKTLVNLSNFHKWVDPNTSYDNVSKNSDGSWLINANASSYGGSCFYKSPGGNVYDAQPENAISVIKDKQYTLILRFKESAPFRNISLNYLVDRVATIMTKTEVVSSVNGFVVFKFTATYTGDVWLNIQASETRQYNLVNILLLEGDYTQNPPSYFDGLKSVGDGVDKIEVLSQDKYLKSSDFTITNFIYNTSSSIITSSSSAKTLVIKLSDFNKEYTITRLAGKSFRVFTTKAYPAIGGTINKTIANHTGKEIKIYCGNDDNYLCIYFYDSTDTLTSEAILSSINIFTKQNKKQILYQTKEGSYEKPILRSVGSVSDTIEKHSDGKYYLHKRCGQRAYQSNDETKSDVVTDKTNTVYKLATEEVYECVNLDLDSYEGETSVIFDGGAISPKITFKIASHIANTVQVLKDRINYLEDKVMNMFKAVLCGDVQTLAYELYPEDFEHEIIEEETTNEIETLEN